MEVTERPLPPGPGQQPSKKNLCLFHNSQSGQTRQGSCSISVYDSPVSNTTIQKKCSWQELFERCTGKPELLPDNKAETKARNGAYFVRGEVVSGHRDDDHLGLCHLIIMDVDKAVDGLPLPTPKEIHESLNDIAHAVYNTATPGRSRIVFLVKPYRKEDTDKLTRAVYQFCRSRGLNFKFAGESNTKSQPWFLPQTTDSEAHQAYGRVDGDMFDPSKVDLPEDEPEQVEPKSSHNPMRDFIADLKSGTIHQAAKKYAGWRVKTTNLSMRQVFDELDEIINACCSDREKVTRWFNGERASLEVWFNFNVSSNAEEWPEPLPLKAELPPVQKMLEEMIPEPFRAWVVDAADRMQVPQDFLIAPLLVVCGSVVGTSCKIRPKRLDDWEVTPNLWGGIVGPPSFLKTPSLNETVNKTLGRLEAKAREKHEAQLQEHDVSVMVGAAQKKALQSAMEKAAKQEAAGKSEGKSVTELANKINAFGESEPPTERRYRTNDSSIEKIVELLNENPRGLLYFRDELIGLFKRAERAGNEQDRAFLLESWNGDGSHVDDRIGRGTVRTDNLCISLLGGIQPDKLSGYLHGAINEGENDGFVQRLQLMVYPDPVGKWQYLDRKPDMVARERAYRIIERLAEMEFEGEINDE